MNYRTSAFSILMASMLTLTFLAGCKVRNEQDISENRADESEQQISKKFNIENEIKMTEGSAVAKIYHDALPALNVQIFSGNGFDHVSKSYKSGFAIAVSSQEKSVDAKQLDVGSYIFLDLKDSTLSSKSGEIYAFDGVSKRLLIGTFSVENNRMTLKELCTGAFDGVCDFDVDDQNKPVLMVTSTRAFHTVNGIISPTSQASAD